MTDKTKALHKEEQQIIKAISNYLVVDEASRKEFKSDRRFEEYKETFVRLQGLWEDYRAYIIFAYRYIERYKTSFVAHKLAKYRSFYNNIGEVIITIALMLMDTYIFFSEVEKSASYLSDEQQKNIIKLTDLNIERFCVYTATIASPDIVEMLQEEAIKKQKSQSTFLKESLKTCLIPSSSEIGLIKKLIQTGGKAQKPIVNKNASLQTQEKENHTVYSYESKSTTAEIVIVNPKKLLSRQDMNTQKIFNLMLEKYNQQRRAEIVFPLSELVEKGIYKTVDTARKGADRAIKKIMGIHIKATNKRGKKTATIARQQLITKSNISRGVCIITVFPELYDYLCQFYVYMPSWGYQLGGNAFSLLDYCCCRARQSITQIKGKQSFKISLNTMSEHLALPNPKETQRHSEYIIYPILEAIEEIEQTQADYINNNVEIMRVHIKPCYPDNYKNAFDFLGGHLEISFDDETTKKITTSVKQFPKKELIKS